MSSAFKAEFPTDAIRNLKGYTQDSGDSAVWARKQIASAQVGDIVVGFRTPAFTQAGPLQTAALYLVFKVQHRHHVALELSDDEYRIGDLENLLAEQADAAREQQRNFFLATAVCLIDVDEQLIAEMPRFGRSGNRHDPPPGLPDPLVAFLAAVGAPITATTPVSIDTITISLIAGTLGTGIPDLSLFYNLLADAPLVPEQVLESMGDSSPADSATEPEKAPDSGEAGREPVADVPVREPVADVPVREPAADVPVPEPVADVPVREPAADVPVREPAADVPAGPADDTPTAVEPEPFAGPERGPADAGHDFELTTPGSEAIKDKLTKLAMALDALPEGTELAEGTSTRGDSRSVPPMVANVLEQMSQSGERLEERLTKLRAELVYQLDSGKHELQEKEDSVIGALRQAKEQCLRRMSELTEQGKTSIGQSAAAGRERIKQFQETSSQELAAAAGRHRSELNRIASDAKQIVQQSVAKTDNEIRAALSATEEEFTEFVAVTEESFAQITSECATKLDERISRFQMHGRLLCEGVVLSLESVCESAKLGLHHSGQDCIDRIGQLFKEAQQSLQEQAGLLDKEFETQIAGTIGQSLLPQLQARRQGMLALAENLHDEIERKMQLLLKSKSAEFGPLSEACDARCAQYLELFEKGRREALDRHQAKLAERVAALNEQVEKSISEADALREGLKGFTMVADQVLADTELKNMRDIACAKFEAVGRSNAARVQSVLGTKLQKEIAIWTTKIKRDREASCAGLQEYGDKRVKSITAALDAALEELEHLQRIHAGGYKE